MAITDLSKLDVPAEFVADRRAMPEDVSRQAVVVDLDWWNEALRSRSLPGHLQGTPEHHPDLPLTSHGRASISRQRLCDLADGSTEDAEQALNLLWHSLAWGAGTSARNMNRRLDSLASDQAVTKARLTEAARLSRTDPKAAYSLLRPAGRTLFPYLGPAFFTKFLYFAGAGDPSHPSLILDARVAQSLHDLGWTSLRSGGWPAVTYQRYTDLLSRWAKKASTPQAQVRPDELELWLFRR